MKYTVLFNLLYLLLPSLAFAQEDFQLEWAKMFNKGEEDVAHCIIQDTEGNYLIAGTTQPNRSKNHDIDVLKLDASGKLLWGKKFGKSGNDIAKSIIETQDGNYVLAGSSGKVGQKVRYLGIMKMNKNGEMLWRKVYENPFGGIANAVIQTEDGGFAVAGATLFKKMNALVVKFSAYGEVEWSKTFGGKDAEEASDIKQTPDGGFVVAGKTNSKGYGAYDAWILKLDAAGTLKWDRPFGGKKYDEAESIALSPEGGVVVAGKTNSKGRGAFDIWVFKLDSKGQIEWDKTFGGTADDQGKSITKAPSGGYLVAGNTKSQGYPKKMWALSIGEDGTLQWEQVFDGRPHPTLKKQESTEANCIFPTQDGGYVVAGNTGLFLMHKLILKFTPQSGAFEEEVEAIAFEHEAASTSFEPPVSVQDGSSEKSDFTPKEAVVESPPVTIKIPEIDLDIPNTNLEKPNTFALIIGNEDYTTFQPNLESESNVDFAANDARIFKEYCVNTLGVPDRNVNLLINATYGQMLQALTKLEKLAKVSEGKAELIFYYAGHGLPDETTKEGYLMPTDISGVNVTSGIALKDLYSQLSKHPTQRVTVFLDACFSGAGRSQGLLAMRGVRIRAKSEPIKGNMVVFTSSTGLESSAPYQEKQHGLFTYFLLKKWHETGGQCSYGEMADYLREKVRLESVLVNSKEQTPEILVGRVAKETWEKWQF